jgi:hypothetical protein
MICLATTSVFAVQIKTSQAKGRLYWGSHCGGYEEFCLLGYNAVWPSVSRPTIRGNMSPPSSGLNNKPSNKSGSTLLAACFMLVSCLANYST